MKTQFIISLKILGIMIILTGIIYPLFITGFSQLCYNDKANGSLIQLGGATKGSLLIGQQFDSHSYFTSRPSATGYNTLPSGASNAGPTNSDLYKKVQERKQQFLSANMLPANTTLPAEMLVASASGLDPHISPEAALLQVNRITTARNFSQQQKEDLLVLIEDLTEKPQFQLLGKPRINVLLLNMGTDKINK